MNTAQALRYEYPDVISAAYQPPLSTFRMSLKELLCQHRGAIPRAVQDDFLKSATSVLGGRDDMRVFAAGDLSRLAKKCVSIVGARDVSSEGGLRAERLARELVHLGIVVVSGLAKGVDTAALSAAVAVGGQTIAVIGTPLDKAYPAENKRLQETMWRDHLLLTPFGPGEAVFKSNFPKRNRLMATISDATVIVEASDTSGTLHQAKECQRLKRPLFIMRSVAENPDLQWPASFLKGPNAFVLESTKDIAAAING